MISGRDLRVALKTYHSKLDTAGYVNAAVRLAAANHEVLQLQSSRTTLEGLQDVQILVAHLEGQL